MNMSLNILLAVAVLGLMGLILGLALAVASKFLAVEKDERIGMISELLPGANCGGCGYAGCSAYAEALLKGEAKIGACGGCKNNEKVAEILGIKADAVEKRCATIMCDRSCEGKKYAYDGDEDCISAMRYAGGSSSCSYGCLGFGNCIKVCKFDAISRDENGRIVIDEEKCTACGACVEECPKKVISIIPKKVKYYVACSSHDKGKDMKFTCPNGCIGCGICAKNCPSGAIKVENNLAKIDYSLCTSCGICAEKCPKKIIACKTV